MPPRGGDTGGPLVQLVPARFDVIGGGNQVDTVARELKDMIALQVVASDGITAVPSYPINWTALDGGSVFAGVVYSGTDGVAGCGASTMHHSGRAPSRIGPTPLNLRGP